MHKKLVVEKIKKEQNIFNSYILIYEGPSDAAKNVLRIDGAVTCLGLAP